MCKAIINANVVTPNGIVFDGIVVVKDNRIYDVTKNASDIPEGAEVIDANGAYVGPGFVDIHVHGRGAYATYDADAKVAEEFLRHGTTTLLATPYYSQNFETILQAIADAKEAMKKSSVIKGLYLEGPYTSPYYGANQDTNPWRHGLVPEEYKAIVDACGKDVKVWTIAPELEGMDGFLAYAREVNPDVVFALGHSEANPEEVEALGKYRPTIMTHTMNATGRRKVLAGTRGYGPDEYCFSTPDMYAELICDSYGMHVNAMLQRMLLKIKGYEKVVLVTDSTAIEAPSPEHLAHITDLNFDHNGDLNGSQLTMDQACKNIMSHTSCGIAQAFAMASLNPAKAVHMDDKIGSIEKGKIADLVFVDDRFNVLKVMTGGKIYE